MAGRVMSRILLTQFHLAHANSGLNARDEESVMWAKNRIKRPTVRERGRGRRSLVKRNPASVAPPTIAARGRGRPKPHVRAWGTMQALQNHPTTPIHGRS